jgi:hypothetical protein
MYYFIRHISRQLASSSFSVTAGVDATLIKDILKVSKEWTTQQCNTLSMAETCTWTD